MKRCDLIKFWLSFPIFYLFFSCLISGAVLYSSENKSSSFDLYFNLDNGELRLKEAVLVPTSTTQSTFLQNGYKIELHSQEGKLLFQTYFRNPGIVYYDLLDTLTLNLSGGAIIKDQKLFKIRIPYLPEIKELDIIDQEGSSIFNTELSLVLSQVRKTSLYPAWEVDTIMYNGEPSNRIDIVFLGDGYTINDIALYASDVQDYVNFMFNSVTPYKEYSTYFNVYKVTVISQESGSDHPEVNPPVYRNTALGTYYGCAGIDRLICADDESVYAAAQSVPWYDEIAVLVNDPTYGGSGGGYLTSYNGYWGPYVYMHELGHSFALLADEYLYGSYPGSVSSCNCDESYSHPGWQSWIDMGSPGVGTYLGCSYNNLYRPTYDACMMRSLQINYCVVCREQTIKSIYERVAGYDSYSPSTDVLNIDTLMVVPFELATLVPNTHSLKLKWFVNNQLKSSDNPFDFSSSTAGYFIIKGTVFDSTAMVLDDPQNLLVDSKEWQVTVGSFVCGDPNRDNLITVSDVVFLIDYLFKEGSEPYPLASADVNLDQKVTVSDVVYLI
jgi:hypothetical protein